MPARPVNGAGPLAVVAGGVNINFAVIYVLHRAGRLGKMRVLFGGTPARSPLYTGVNAMKTFSAKPETVKRDWFVIDASGKTLGRLATELARRLRGKHKPEYTPHVDTGDYLVVINAGKIAITGNKAQAKKYYHHTGYPGGLKSITFDKLIVAKPEKPIEIAVKGMLPKGPLGRAMLSKLKVYGGAEHPHAAQQPQELKI